MIPNLWYVALESCEVPKGKVLGATRFGKKMVFWRNKDGIVHCIEDKCCHRGAALCLGQIVENHIECPFHGLQYDETGKVVCIPANGKTTPVPAQFKVDGYIVKESHGFIWLWYGELQSSYPEIPFFEDIDEKFPYKTLRDHWPVHYTRAIENQLDVVHLPFVHKTTIGRGMGTVIDGPILKISHKSNTIEEEVCVFNRKEDGTPAKKAEEMTFDPKKNYLHFRFPHIWQNRILDKMRVFIAFVPIDDENTMLYMRYYQKFVSFPGLKQIVNAFGVIFSKKVLYQDKRVVVSQIPKKTSYKMSEKLLQGDSPIIEYRRIRDILMEKKGNISVIEEKGPKV